MNTWTSASGLVFVLDKVEMIATGSDPGASVAGTWYPLSEAEAHNLRDAVIDMGN